MLPARLGETHGGREALLDFNPGGPVVQSLDPHKARTLDFQCTVSRDSFTPAISFLHQTVDLDYNFHAIIALLEYSVACKLCTRASAPVITIELMQCKCTLAQRRNVPQP